MPILLTGGLPNDYREANGYSTEAACRDGRREVDRERTKAIIRMTFTETLPNAESRDGEICKCNAQSGFPRAEAFLLHGCHPPPMQLASILPPPSGHRECYTQFTVTMPGAEAHIVVQSQDETHVMIDFPYLTLANSDNGLCRDPTLRNQS
jgi:hypothetical protein